MRQPPGVRRWGRAATRASSARASPAYSSAPTAIATSAAPASRPRRSPRPPGPSVPAGTTGVVARTARQACQGRAPVVKPVGATLLSSLPRMLDAGPSTVVRVGVLALRVHHHVRGPRGDYLGLGGGAVGWGLAGGLGSYYAGPTVTDVFDDVGLVGSLAIATAIVVAVVVGRWRMVRSRRA